MDEIWKPVVDREGFYEVSNLGRVRSVDRIIFINSKSRRGHSRRRAGRIIHIKPNMYGYIFVQLWNNNSRETLLVHRLVAQAFIPNPLGLQEVDHVFRNKNDNRASQLEWVTKSENIERAIRDGAYRKKLNPKQIAEICAAHPTETTRKIAARFGISHSTVSSIITGKIHRFVDRM